MKLFSGIFLNIPAKTAMLQKRYNSGHSLHLLKRRKHFRASSKLLSFHITNLKSKISSQKTTFIEFFRVEMFQHLIFSQSLRFFLLHVKTTFEKTAVLKLLWRALAAT